MIKINPTTKTIEIISGVIDKEMFQNLLESYKGYTIDIKPEVDSRELIK